MAMIEEAEDGTLDNPSGYFPDVYLVLKEAFGFDTNYTRPADRKWGIRNPNGSWNGIVGMMQR